MAATVDTLCSPHSQTNEQLSFLPFSFQYKGMGKGCGSDTPVVLYMTQAGILTAFRSSIKHKYWRVQSHFEFSLLLWHNFALIDRPCQHEKVMLPVMLLATDGEWQSSFCYPISHNATWTHSSVKHPSYFRTWHFYFKLVCLIATTQTP